jgi:hypothetical protein
VIVPADLVVRNARIWSDGRRLRASAFAVSGGRFVALGRDKEITFRAGRSARSVDLGGRVILPGLIDSHTHILEVGRRLSQVDLTNCSSLEAAVEAVRAFASELREGCVLGGGWDANVWGVQPTAAALDCATRLPAVLRSHDCHSAWANGAALRAAGITRETPEPSGGIIERDASGDPTGVLREGAVALVERILPAPVQSDISRQLDLALALAARHGLTCVHTFEGPEVLSASQDVRRHGHARPRMRCHLRRGSLDDALRLGLRTGFGDAWLRVGSLKLFADGALGTQTAWMLDPYSGRDAYLGVATLTQPECEHEIARAARGGIASAVHAIGDAANRMVLDAFEATRAEWQPIGLRQRIEHAQCLAPADLPRLARLGIVAAMQPTHAVSDYPVAERQWGDRCGGAYAWRSLLSQGTVLAFGSDAPVESLDPLLGVHAAVTRTRADGAPPGGWRMEQHLTVDEALTAYTRGSAYASGEEAELGRIAPGYLADFVVLDRDPWSDDLGWLGARVDVTVVEGVEAHGSLDEIAQ